MSTAVVLVAHGTVDDPADLPEFLTNIRRGHPPPPELVTEMERRYAAIGGRSPLNTINRELGQKLAAHLGLEVRVSNRLFHPYPKEVLSDLVGKGISRVVVVALAQHSSYVYVDSVKRAAKEIGVDIEIVPTPNWGRNVALTHAFADAVTETLKSLPPGEAVPVVFTAHSLPLSVIEGGDPYEKEFRASADDVESALRARGVPFAEALVAFQSQGMSGGAWLGPDLRATLEGVAKSGKTRAVIAPVGFLADHVEILYDLDIEAKAWARDLQIELFRSPSLNVSHGLVVALASVVRTALGDVS